MADKKRVHPYTSGAGKGETDEALQSIFRDEGDGAFSLVVRARLEAFDGSSWVRIRANPNGSLLLDKGVAGADASASGHFTTAQSGTILYNGTSTEIVHVTAVIVTNHNSTSASPSARVQIGTTTVASHPGMPPGGGFAFSDIDIAGAVGDDITFTCDTPTGGSIDVAVHYYKEASP